MQTALTDRYGGREPREATRTPTRSAAGRARAMRRAAGAMSYGVRDGAERRANGLGWFSLGLGLTALLAPRRLAMIAGIADDASARNLTRMIGAREILSGLGILSGTRPAAWLWARVIGDVVDLALLGRSLGMRKANRPKLLRSMASVAGILLLDGVTAVQARRSEGGAAANVGRNLRRGGIRVVRTITVNRPPDEVYRFWRDLENLPRFMAHLDSVHVVDGRSHWRAKGPAGAIVEWDATIVDDRPNERLAWRSVEGADVPNAGTVELSAAPGGKGTVVRVDLRYDPPGRRIGALLAKAFGEEPSQQIAGDLRRFKQVIETGEVVHSDASIHRGPHAARPPSDEEMFR